MTDSKLTREQSNFIEKLYFESVISVYKLVCSMIHGNKIDREAIVQDTFELAIQKVDSLMKHSNPIQWLFTTARNKVMDELKRKINVAEIPTSYEELDVYEDIRLRRECDFSSMEDILTEDEINLLKKHWEEGYLLSEIADMNSVKLSTIKMRMSRIYAKIKKSKIMYS